MAVVAEDVGARARAAARLRRALRVGRGRPLLIADALGPSAAPESKEGETVGDPSAVAWTRVWAGARGPEGRPEAVLAAAETLLLPLCGGGRLFRLLDRLQEGGAGRAEGRDRRARALALEGAPEELRRVERELRSLRADHAEAAGDLEAASVEWLRERQDAETQLLAYRDRARELKARLAQIEAAGPDAPCLICGRPLAEVHPDVVSTLREEWETVVQDGSWWKRRREQLEGKPEHVKGLEERTLRLQVAVEGCAERAERARVRARELEDLRDFARALPTDRAAGSDSSPAAEATDPVLAAIVEDALAELRAGVRGAVLERATPYLVRASGGSLLGFTDEHGGSVRCVGVGGAGRQTAEDDEELAALCLRLAAAVLLHERGAEGDTLLVEDRVPAAAQDTRARILDLLEDAAGVLQQVVVLTDGSSVDAAAERFVEVWEVREDGERRAALERVPSGPAWLRLRPTTRSR